MLTIKTVARERVPKVRRGWSITVDITVRRVTIIDVLNIFRIYQCSQSVIDICTLRNSNIPLNMSIVEVSVICYWYMNQLRPRHDEEKNVRLHLSPLLTLHSCGAAHASYATATPVPVW